MVWKTDNSGIVLYARRLAQEYANEQAKVDERYTTYIERKKL